MCQLTKRPQAGPDAGQPPKPIPHSSISCFEWKNSTKDFHSPRRAGFDSQGRQLFTQLATHGNELIIYSTDLRLYSCVLLHQFFITPWTKQVQYATCIAFTILEVEQTSSQTSATNNLLTWLINSHLTFALNELLYWVNSKRKKNQMKNKNWPDPHVHEKDVEMLFNLGSGIYNDNKYQKEAWMGPNKKSIRPCLFHF